LCQGCAAHTRTRRRLFVRITRIKRGFIPHHTQAVILAACRGTWLGSALNPTAFRAHPQPGGTFPESLAQGREKRSRKFSPKFPAASPGCESCPRPYAVRPCLILGRLGESLRCGNFVVTLNTFLLGGPLGGPRDRERERVGCEVFNLRPVNRSSWPRPVDPLEPSSLMDGVRWQS
jgi:hypothetical protein